MNPKSLLSIAALAGLGAVVGTPEVSSPSHNVDVVKADAGRMMCALKNAQSIPNKDFILRYDVAGAKIKDAVLTHKSADKGGFFTLILQPPDRVVESEVMSKEIVSVVDTSGSMHGYLMDKIKETIKFAFDALQPRNKIIFITKVVNENGRSRVVCVPVEMPEGVGYDRISAGR